MSNQIINDGGPAFPESASGPYPNGEINEGRPGMTLRDWFAATIPLATYEQEQIVRLYVGGSIAQARQLEVDKRYMKADAMIAARAKAEGRAE